MGLYVKNIIYIYINLDIYLYMWEGTSNNIKRT